MDVIIKDFGVVTPFGIGSAPLWKNLTSGKSAIAPCERFDVSRFDCKSASILPKIVNQSMKNASLIWNLITPLQTQIKEWNCDVLILATTKGEIDLLEDDMAEQARHPRLFVPPDLDVVQVPAGVVL